MDAVAAVVDAAPAVVRASPVAPTKVTGRTSNSVPIPTRTADPRPPMQRKGKAARTVAKKAARPRNRLLITSNRQLITSNRVRSSKTPRAGTSNRVRVSRHVVVTGADAAAAVAVPDSAATVVHRSRKVLNQKVVRTLNR